MEARVSAPPFSEGQDLQRGIEEDMRRPQDLLSFISLFCAANQIVTTDMWISQVLLDRFIPWIRNPTGDGSSFSVNIVETSVLQQGITHTLPTALFGGRDKVALKKPKLSGEPTSSTDRYIWESIAAEFQILSHPILCFHPNIVKLLGIAWQSAEEDIAEDTKGEDQRIISPVLVLEAAETGNLTNLYETVFTQLNERDLLRAGLKLCRDIASGIQTLHECQAIHADLKPENILIFHTQNGSHTAKLADFGSSVSLPDESSTVRLKEGTLVWRAPECTQPLSRSQLIATDIYSFGMLMLDILLAGKSHEWVEHFAKRGPIQLESKKCIHLIACTLVYAIYGHEMLSFLLLDCLEYSSTKRPKTMRSVLERLQGIMTDEHAERHDQPEEQGPINSGDQQTRVDSAEQRSLATPDGSFVSLTTWLLDPNNLQLPKLSHNYGTMRLLPPKLLHQVMDLLENVARNDHDVHWQGTAAFQLAFALVCGLDTRQRDSLSLALEMLLLAATAGDIEAQATVGWIHETFGKRMDASNNQELDWLYRATTLGFPTARRRLFRLDRQAHDNAIYELCHDDGTTSKQMFRGRWPDLWELEYAYIPFWEAGREVQPAILHYYASIGLAEAISLVTEKLEIDVNELGPQDATPLSLACRSGHLNAVRVLLHLGADPKIADAAGTTPLHWLASFHESEMRELVQLLLQHGADIEVRSKPTTMHISQDSTLLHVGRHGGTPLLWAVANFSLPATQALLDSGADPWDEAGEEVPRSNRFGNNVHLSPVHFAARGHMDEILELLLRNQANPDILNTHYRVMGSAEQSFAILPLGWAVTYGGFGMLEAISWHGKNYKSACQRTIELLLKHGANPTRLTSDGHSALELASQWGQGFAISFLEPFLTQNFVPTASIFRSCIKHAIVRGDTEVFDALINITREVTSIVLEDISLLSFASTRSDSTHFLTALLDSRVQVGQPQGTTIFEQALAQGNYEIATLFHDRGLFDPVCYDRIDFDLGSVKEGRFTVLGKLLISTIFSSSLLRAVHFVLERLPCEDTSSTEPSPAFWVERKDHLSALHLAAFIHEFRKDLTQGSETMDKLLYLFNQVHHLNSPCKIYGFTPLHLAVYCGNIPAIRTLLGEDDVDRQSLDDLGRTPMDVALFRHYEDTDTETMDAFLSWMPPGWRPSPRSQIGTGIRSKRNVEVLSELMGQNLQTKKYLSVVIRDSEEAVSIITPNNIVENRLTLISVPSGERRSPSSKSIPSSHLLVSLILNGRRPLFSITSKPGGSHSLAVDRAELAEIRRNPFLRKLVDMAVGEVKFLKSYESMGAAVAEGHSPNAPRMGDNVLDALRIGDLSVQDEE